MSLIPDPAVATTFVLSISLALGLTLQQTSKKSARPPSELIAALLNSLRDLRNGYLTTNSKAYRELMRVLYESRRRQLIQNAPLWGDPELARKLQSTKFDLM